MCKKDELLLNTATVQQQKNGVDCGPFATAFATSLAFEIDPSTVTFDVDALRPHLVQCLEKGQMEPFPTIFSKRSIRAKKQGHVVELFCSYRKPDEQNTRMVQCDICEEWFHKRCEKVPGIIFKNKTKEWTCRYCHKQ